MPLQASYALVTPPACLWVNTPKKPLTNLGWWDTIGPRLVETEDVRAALNFVNRGECQLGIVYATDAKVVKNCK